jgi:hypothetical protein
MGVSIFFTAAMILTFRDGSLQQHTVLPGRWTGRASGNDQQLMLWPPGSPEITLCDLFLVGGYVKDRVFISPLTRNPADLKGRIIAEVKNIDAPMLTCVWQELEYRSDVCAVSPVVHPSNISSCQKNFFSFPVAVNNSIKKRPV